MAKPPAGFREYLASLGRKGGRKRAKRLTAARRREIARGAAEARWEKHRKQGDRS